MDLLGKPAKIISYRNLKLKLYKNSVLLKMLGHTRHTVWQAEKKGLFPSPFITNKHIKYYTDYELFALAECIRIHGHLQFRPGKKLDKFKLDVEERWLFIREYIKKGISPPTPLFIRFESFNDLMQDLEIILSPYGLSGHKAISNIANTLLEKTCI